LVVSGCVENAEEPMPKIEIIRDSAQVDVSDEPDLCAIASELSSDDVCSMICDPDAMAEFLVAGGMQGGKCVQLRCELPGVAAVLVGVCLPP
jgi:hypothetical protein